MLQKLKSMIEMITAVFITLIMMTSITFAAEFMSVTTAAKQSQANQIFLIDIRTPREWQQTGVAKHASKITMHQDGFLAKVTRLVDGDKAAPIALICARGNRSTRMINLLEQNGYTNVYNVSEGMLGSNEGPGWLAKGLPLK